MLHVEVPDKPATSAIVATCCTVWLVLNHRGGDYDAAGSSYRRVVEEGQYWRLLTSQISHIHWMHLLFNMSSLWSLGYVEKARGSGSYLRTTLILTIFSKLLLMGFYHLMVKVAKREYYRSVVSVGYSSVVFGWMAKLSVGGRRTVRFRMLGLASVPAQWAPIASVVATSILIPRVSFFGHLSGVAVGYLIGFGYFEWFNVYWSVTACFWSLLGILWSLLANSPEVQIPFLRSVSDEAQMLIER